MTIAMNTHDPSRRFFLRQAGAMGSLLGAAAAPLALNLAAAGSAAAQGAGDYKALVCVFLFGGNDALNMVLPTDPTSWSAYNAVRNQAPDPIALLAAGTAANPNAPLASLARLGGVLPLTPRTAQSRSFALHPSMAGVQTLFNNDRRLAIVPGIGPLLMPTSKLQFKDKSHPKPASLFSHNDQANTWQAMAPEGATSGWGGRMGDMLASMNGLPVFTAVSAAGNAVWLSGQQVQQYQLGSNGAIRMGGDANGRIFGSSEVTASMQRIASRAHGAHVFERDIAAVGKRSLDAEVALRSALKPASDAMFGTAPASGNYNASTDPKLQFDNPQTGAPAFNSLAQQLQVVARMIEAGGSSTVQARRQVFFVSMGGFDTHDNQVRSHATLMAKLSHALKYFDTTLGAMGARSKVTTFTASDFGRTFTSNGDGTDHGWGSHHFVMGGAVRGGDLYGNFPVLGTKNPDNNGFDSSPNQIANGALLPETSVDQLAATLGGWFGLSGGQLNELFPNLANFDAGKRNLGFMA